MTPEVARARTRALDVLLFAMVLAPLGGIPLVFDSGHFTAWALLLLAASCVPIVIAGVLTERSLKALQANLGACEVRTSGERMELLVDVTVVPQPPRRFVPWDPKALSLCSEADDGSERAIFAFRAHQIEVREGDGWVPHRGAWRLTQSRVRARFDLPRGDWSPLSLRLYTRRLARLHPAAFRPVGPDSTDEVADGGRNQRSVP